MIGAGAGAVTSVWLSHWLVGNWFVKRYEPRVRRIQQINESMGNVGLYVVMGIRLCHILPFGVSNYLFGLTRISAWAVFFGTITGAIPAIGVYVIAGAALRNQTNTSVEYVGYIDWFQHVDWRPWAFLAAVNIVLLIPLVVRYYNHRNRKKQ